MASFKVCYRTFVRQGNEIKAYEVSLPFGASEAKGQEVELDIKETKSVRAAALSFLATLDPSCVYGVSDGLEPDNHRAIVVYYRKAA